MSIIGDALKQARERAGLSVADVSAQTRIHANLIRAIERDDFDACGGDFYARGHIRAIARVVGADSLPLISEYDAAHPDAGPYTLDDLLAAPAGALAGTDQGPGPSPRGPNPWRMLPIVFGALAVIGVGVYWVSADAGGPSPQPAAASRPAASRPAAVSATSASASGPAPSPSHSPSASPSPSPRVSQATARPQSATAFGPGGTSAGDNSRSASGSRGQVRESRPAGADRPQCRLLSCRDPRRVPGPHRGSGRRAAR